MLSAIEFVESNSKVSDIRFPGSQQTSTRTNFRHIPASSLLNNKLLLFSAIPSARSTLCRCSREPLHQSLSAVRCTSLSPGSRDYFHETGKNLSLSLSKDHRRTDHDLERRRMAWPELLASAGTMRGVTEEIEKDCKIFVINIDVKDCFKLFPSQQM